MDKRILETISNQVHFVLNNSNNVLYINRLYKLFISLFLEMKFSGITNDVEITFCNDNIEYLRESIFFFIKFKFKKKLFGIIVDEVNSPIEFILREDRETKYILYQNKLEVMKEF